MSQFTDWYPPHIKPVWAGVYNASYSKDKSIFRYWDGKYWTWGWTVKDGSKYIKYAKKHYAVDLHIHWRGLSAAPTPEGK